MQSLGSRVAIVGVAGAGKSTLALHLNKTLALPLYHTDQFIWAEGWENPKPNQAIIAYIDTIIALPDWLLEGYLGYLHHDDKRLQKATTVIVLDYGRWRLAWHILKRNWQHHNCKRSEMPDTCIERFGWHTIRWVVRHFMKSDLRKNMHNWTRHVDTRHILIFRSPRQLETWLHDQSVV